MSTKALPGLSPGQRIEMARNRRHLTQETAASLAGWSIHLWRKWEYNERIPSMSQWGDIARVLGVRDLYDLTGVAHAIAPDDEAEHRAVRPILNAMLGTYGPRDLTSPTDFPGQVSDLWTVWQSNAAERHEHVGELLPCLIASGEAAARDSDGANPDDVRMALASLYQCAGSYLRNVGSPQIGLIAAERAMRAAEDADNPDSLAAAGWWRAASLSSARQTDAAFGVCLKLIGDIEPRISAGGSRALTAVYGQLHCLAAVQAARRRQDTRADELLAAAARVAVLTGEYNAFHTAFGPTNVLIHRATSEAEQCRYRRAIDVASQVDVTRSPSVERRVAHLVNLAGAYVGSRNPVAALATLTAACDDDAAEVGSLVLAHETARWLHSKRTPSSAADVGRLLHRMGIAA